MGSGDKAVKAEALLRLCFQLKLGVGMRFGLTTILAVCSSAGILSSSSSLIPGWFNLLSFGRESFSGALVDGTSSLLLNSYCSPSPRRWFSNSRSKERLAIRELSRGLPWLA